MTKIQPDIINFAEKCVRIPTLKNDSTQNIVLNEWQKEKLNEWQNNNKNNYMFTCQHEPRIGCSTIQLIQALYNVTFKNDSGHHVNSKRNRIILPIYTYFSNYVG